MRPVAIFADSTCDLSAAQCRENNISIIPLYVILNENSLRDSIDITANDVYAQVEQTKQLPKTSAASMQDFIHAWTPWIEKGHDIVYISLSSKLSASFQNARTAAEAFPQGRVFAVDGRTVSTGIGLTVLKAAELAKEGMSAEEIARQAELLTKRQRTSFIIDSLTYLRRGGRCSALTAFGANLLNITPEIVAEDGALVLGRKFRGSLRRSAKKYVAGIIENLDKIDPQRVFLTHTPCSEELLTGMREALQATGYFGEICETEAGCVIGSHCGPGTVGILYFMKE